jgi:CHAT domain-containing protein/tetratricopeptide (TPR) repeat protein
MGHLEGKTAKRNSRLLAKGLLLACLIASHEALPSDAPADSQDAKQAIARVRAMYEADKKRLPETEVEAKRVLASLERSRGPDSPEVIELSGLLVHILMEIGKFRLPEALKVAERTLAAAERVYPSGDMRLVTPLRDLGGVLDYIGSFAEAREIWLRWLEIVEARGSELDVALALDHQGYIHRQLGDYAAARVYLERSVDLYDRNPGLDPTHMWGVLKVISEVCRQEGDLDEALAYAERNVRMSDRIKNLERVGRYHGALTYLADVYRDMGRHEEAIAIWDRCAVFYQEHLGETGDLVKVLSNQARSKSLLGRHEEAVAQAERALQMQARIVLPDDRNLVDPLVNLALVHIDAGEDVEARPLLDRAVHLQIRAYGPKHDSVAPLLDLLSRVEYRLGLDTEAMEHGLQSESVAREGFQDIATVISERQAYRFETRRASGLQVVLSLLGRRQGKLSPDLVKRVWDEIIRSRALVLDELSARHRAAAIGEGPEIASISLKLNAARSRLSAIALRALEPAFQTKPSDVAEAQARKDALEQELTRRSAEYRRRLQQWDTGFSRVQGALPTRAALLAYLEYEPMAGAAALSARPQIAALFLSSSSPGPSFIPLGSAHDIEDAIRRWREKAGTAPTGLPTLPGSGDAGYAEAGRQLRRLIWDPVVTKLQGVDAIFIVPDASLQLVNLAALPADDGRYLVEAGPVIHHLSTERDLVRQAARRYTGDGALIVGDPDLDARTPMQIASTRSVDSTAPACAEFRQVRFAPLAASRDEVRDVRSLLSPNASIFELTGPAASESAFKRLAPGRRLIHIATHGFFLQDRCDSALASARARGTAATVPPGTPSQVLGDNPLLLSGLTLAGANRRAESSASSGAEDGILTAEEVASLDLGGVEWAVLSACETGVGKVLPGEGVLGLRRAFAVAGAGTLIMSLWRVDDEATREWMGALYRGRLGGLSTAEAVRNASRTMIRERRQKGKSTHPYYWGGFVAEGDWR